jgi:hypothetical protein
MTAPGPGGAYPCEASFVLGGRPEDMQNSVAWPADDTVVSLSLDGTLNYLRPGAPASEPFRRVCGHVAAVTVLEVDVGTGLLYTGDMAGRVVLWTPVDEGRTLYEGRLATGAHAPTKRLSALAVAGGKLAAAGWDDKLRLGDAATGEFTATVPLPGQPKGIAVSPAAPDVRVVVTGGAVLLVVGETVAASLDAAWGPTCVDVSADGATVAVGGADKRVHMFALAPGGGGLTPGAVSAECGGAISAVAVSPDGARVASGDALREVRLFSAPDAAPLVSGRWMAHTTRVTGLRWSPSGGSLVSVSSDRRICVWDPASDTVKRTFDLAHPTPFAAVAWASDEAVWTAGTDGVLVRRVLAA